MDLRLHVHVVGTGHLADATRACCGLYFQTDCHLSEAHVIWFCVDTPVDEDDISDVDTVAHALDAVLTGLHPGVPVLISSQLPVGTVRKWAAQWPAHCLISQPENIRKATAAEDFLHQARMIVGTTDGEAPPTMVMGVLHRFTDIVMWMSYESAEMTKHTLNAWLAMNIAYANEIADICSLVGADVTDVFRGFRSDARVSGPLIPGHPYRGGTLGRDVEVLNGITLPVDDQRFDLLLGIRFSNEARL